MIDVKKCGRCGKEIKENIFLIEKGFGSVHAKCSIEEIVRKIPTIEEIRRTEYLEKWK